MAFSGLGCVNVAGVGGGCVCVQVLFVCMREWGAVTWQDFLCFISVYRSRPEAGLLCLFLSDPNFPKPAV